MSKFGLKQAFPAAIGAFVSMMAVTALPSQAATITGVDLNGFGNNTGTIELTGNTITVNETFNNPNTVTKVLQTAVSETSNVYNFIVNAVNNTGFTWGSFRFNLNASGNPDNRPTFQVGTISSNVFSSFDLNNTNGFLEFTNGSVADGGSATFNFSVLVPAGYRFNDFTIDERPFRGEGTPIPTPALLPGLLGLGATALRRRRNQEA